MTAIDEMLRRNKTAAIHHSSGLGPSPLKHLAVVMCMDCRVDAHVAFRLNPGEIHLLRNAGGIISDDVIRSLAISQHGLGTREVMIVHHTDCGLSKLNEEEFRDQLAQFAGYRPSWSVQAFKDPHDSVRESMRRIQDSPFLHHTDKVRGFIFDVETGLLEEVPADDEEAAGADQRSGAATG